MQPEERDPAYLSIFRIVRNRLPVLIAMLEPLVPPLPMGE